MSKNPKQLGSNLADCVPQKGPCPLNCPECYYNICFYAGHEPLIPDPRDVYDKVVRVNSGHDSNIDRDFVIEIARQYKDHFFNTSIPNLDFPAPVVLTLDPDISDDLLQEIVYADNLMFIRVKVGLLDYETESFIDFVSKWVPVVITFMRYKTIDNVPDKNLYRQKTHVSNEWFCPTKDHILSVMRNFRTNKNVTMCGTPNNSLCCDCKNCETYYWIAKKRMQLNELL